MSDPTALQMHPKDGSPLPLVRITLFHSTDTCSTVPLHFGVMYSSNKTLTLLLGEAGAQRWSGQPLCGGSRCLGAHWTPLSSKFSIHEKNTTNKYLAFTLKSNFLLFCVTHKMCEEQKKKNEPKNRKMHKSLEENYWIIHPCRKSFLLN